MTTHICLLNFTVQGAQNIKDSTTRAEIVTVMAKNFDIEIKSIFWTMGRYDVVVIVEGAQEAVAAGLMTLASIGNLRSETLCAFSAKEMDAIISNVP